MRVIYQSHWFLIIFPNDLDLVNIAHHDVPIGFKVDAMAVRVDAASRGLEKACPRQSREPCHALSD